jgi:hypothetical protein
MHEILSSGGTEDISNLLQDYKASQTGSPESTFLVQWKFQTSYS